MGAKKSAKKPPKLIAPGRAQSSAGSAAPVAASIPSPADGGGGKLKHAKDRSGKAKKQKQKQRYETSDDAILVMRKQLAAVGCKLFEVEADGNCLFRSIGDQLFGDQHQHVEIRKRIVDLIALKRDDFEPFMEDEEKFEHYCTRMREDGTWGGNQELYAAAKHFQVYIVIHQESSRMVIECDTLRPRKVIHVAYHGSDHYDSVRALPDDGLEGREPREIVLDCDGFRPEDFAKRWKVHAHGASQQQIASTASGGTEEELELVSAIDALHVSANESGDGGEGAILSKKELRKLKKDAKSKTKR
ncbi:hypothetical protein Gpo141_00006444 [Globisporangium polare]